MASETPRSGRLDVDERRRQLIKVGGRLFSDRSFDDISIGEIAEAAGISKGLLYHYFPSKRDFYVATVRTAAEQLIASVAKAETASEDPARAGIDAWLDYVSQHERGYIMLMQGGIGSDAEVRQIAEQTRERFVERIVGAVESPSPALRLAVRGWIGFVEGATLDWLRDRSVGRERLRRLLLGSLRAALQQAAELDPELAAELAQLPAARADS